MFWGIRVRVIASGEGACLASHVDPHERAEWEICGNSEVISREARDFILEGCGRALFNKIFDDSAGGYVR